MPMRRTWAYIAIVSVTGMLSLTASLGPLKTQKLQPPTPTLLRGGIASGGWWSGRCPPEIAQRNDRGIEARSPEIEQRLSQDLPPGTKAEALVRLLRIQGFTAVKPCESDPTIWSADFQQKGGGVFGPFPHDAIVVWKVDGKGNLVWTESFLIYVQTGPDARGAG